MTKAKRSFVCMGATAAVACATLCWVNGDWHRQVRFELLVHGYPFAQVVDVANIPTRQMTWHEMSAAVIRNRGTYVGRVDAALQVRMGMNTSGPPPFAFPFSIKLIFGQYAAGLAAVLCLILSLPTVVLWGRRGPGPTGFPIVVRRPDRR